MNMDRFTISLIAVWRKRFQISTKRYLCFDD